MIAGVVGKDWMGGGWWWTSVSVVPVDPAGFSETGRPAWATVSVYPPEWALTVVTNLAASHTLWNGNKQRTGNDISQCPHTEERRFWWEHLRQHPPHPTPLPLTIWLHLLPATLSSSLHLCFSFHEEGPILRYWGTLRSTNWKCAVMQTYCYNSWSIYWLTELYCILHMAWNKCFHSIIAHVIR